MQSTCGYIRISLRAPRRTYGETYICESGMSTSLIAAVGLYRRSVGDKERGVSHRGARQVRDREVCSAGLALYSTRARLPAALSRAQNDRHRVY